MNIIKNRDFVVVGLQPWDTEIGSNCKNIALELSRYNRVLYVNSPLDRKTKISKAKEPAIRKRIDILNNKERCIEHVLPNLWVYYPDVIIESINWIKMNFAFDYLNKRNNRVFSESISRAIEKLGFVDIILFNDNDIFRSFYLKELLRPQLSIYYSRDYLLGVDYWRYHGTRLEPLLMKKSDICIANSSYLTSICKKYNENSFDVGQGCDLQLFLSVNTCDIPTEFEKISRPIIGYVGTLSSLRLDIMLIEFIAIHKPEWSFVFVGPEDPSFLKSELHRLGNVYFLGSKNINDLPLYINSFDVCINPQILNEVTIGNYPRKIDEYLAVGKPVVAIKTDTMSLFSNYTYLAENKFQFMELVEMAIKEDRPELVTARKDFASLHTWENSVREIYRSILEYERTQVVTAQI